MNESNSGGLKFKSDNKPSEEYIHVLLDNAIYLRVVLDIRSTILSLDYDYELLNDIAI